MIYALLGLATDADDSIFDPDYRAPVTDIYVRSTTAILKQGHSLNLLHETGAVYPKALLGLPTWVPDWSPGSGITTFGFNGDTKGYRASGNSTPNFQSHQASTILTVSGILIDTIAMVGSVHRWRKSIDPNDNNRFKLQSERKSAWDHESSRLARSCQPYPTGEPCEEVHWRTLIANTDHKGAPAQSSYSKNFESAKIVKRAGAFWDNPDYDKDPPFQTISEASVFETAQSNACDGRALFTTTQRKYLGLVLAGVRAGDVICVVLGTSTPFILRRELPCQKEGRQRYFLMAECYIHGLMQGEGMEMGDVREIALK